MVTMRHEGTEDLAGAGYFVRLAVTIRRVVAEHQLRVRSIGADAPQRVTEIGALVEIFGAGPEDVAIAHYGRFPLAQVGEGKPLHV
jgi:hypothetical protein